MPSRFDQIVDEVHADPALAGINYATGRLAEKLNADWPRIVWIPLDYNMGPTDNVGGRPNGANRSRQCRTQTLSCEVHIWGEDLEMAENMLHILIGTCWRLLMGSVDFGAGRYETQTQTGADYAARGQKAIQEITLKIPVQSETAPLTIIDTQEHSGSFVPNTGGAPIPVC